MTPRSRATSVPAPTICAAGRGRTTIVEVGGLPDRALLHPVGELVGHRAAATARTSATSGRATSQATEPDGLQTIVARRSVRSHRDSPGTRPPTCSSPPIATVLEAGEASTAGVVVSGAGGLRLAEGDADQSMRPRGTGWWSGPGCWRPAGSAARSCALASPTVLHVVVVELSMQAFSLAVEKRL